jgi:hypothetical protein
MDKSHHMLHRGIAVGAALFGVATILAGSRVLGGAEPGYVALTPLVVYNTLMGFIYVAAAVLIWRRHGRAVAAAGGIFLLNLIVLVAISGLYAVGATVAVNSLAAMTLRTALWGIGFLVLYRWGARRVGSPPHDRVRGVV